MLPVHLVRRVKRKANLKNAGNECLSKSVKKKKNPLALISNGPRYKKPAHFILNHSLQCCSGYVGPKSVEERTVTSADSSQNNREVLLTTDFLQSCAE